MKKILTLFVLLSFAWAAFAQGGADVKGKITDAATGEPLPFASVIVNGTMTGAMSDENGNYTIPAAGDQTLVFSFFGYKTVSVPVANRAVVDVALETDISQLDEVVVMGYGVQKKKLITGSTVQVKGDDLTKLSSVSALGALQSQTPGVQITQNSGQPGQGYKVAIRGLGTVGDSAPLYVIDGVAGGDINALNPADIESIDVLKDAASAAIYGARAANGVILVTTKKGKDGGMTVTFDGYTGWQYIAKRPDLLNAQQYVEIQNLMLDNQGAARHDWTNILPADLWASVQDGSWTGTDWLEETYNEGAPVMNYAVNIAGGSDRNKVSLGLSYTGQEGILGYNKIDPVNADYERYTFRLNTDNVVVRKNDLDILKVGNTLNFSYVKNNGIAEGDIYWSSIHDVLTANPLLPVYAYDDKGEITGFYDQPLRDADGWTFDSNARNPLSLDYYSSRGRNEDKGYSLQGSVYAELQPIKNLVFRTQFGLNMGASSWRSYTMKHESSGRDYETQDEISQGASMSHRITWDNTVSYHAVIDDKHTLDAVLGQSIEKWGMGSSISGSSVNSIFGNDWEYAWLSNAKPQNLSDVSLSGSPSSEGGLASFFGRVNYSYSDKYLFSAVLRADGSSNFARGHRWGYFPSVSAGWVITGEDFMSGASNWLDFLKLRASWGQNGNASISNFQYLSTIVLDEDAGYYDASDAAPSTGAIGDVLANPDVTWETSEQLDLGIDARFFGSRLSLAFDAYIKNTKDWLVRAPIASVYGLGAPYVNGGDVSNKGIEVSLGWNDMRGDFNYGANLNLAFNKNEVTRIANAEGIIHGEEDVLSEGTGEMYRAEVGYPIGYFYGYKTDGVFQNQAQIDETKAKLEGAQPGDLIFHDENGDGEITPDDRTMIGNPHPDMTLGFNLWFAYKGFDLNISANGAFGQQIAKSYRSFADRPRDNFTMDVYETWTGEGTSNKLPRLTYGSHSNWANISDIYIEDGDYLRISNITLGYDFKKLMRKDSFLGKTRLYVSVLNPFTFTNYSGMDPEIGYGYGEDWVSGIDLGYYPSARTYMVGINIQF